MENIKIVEYSPKLAEAVADMWNKSAAGWNGMNTARTAEIVIREHNNAHHLYVFLAMEGDTVIGYCSLDKYTHDEGALYVNTLNVRPDYHGKKVGKMLVLSCVNKTVELGWPRVDLYTWPGNTKAVPLYKKCGFFWEKRDETTHLMNYIPTVIKTEALTDFFQDIDWYNDSKRVIEVKPDGRKENGFDYFEYTWEKSGKNLRVEFERTGRGMRLIETDDYCIRASIENHELVFGMDYTIQYNITNKSGKPLHVELNGVDDKNISFNMKHSVDLSDNTTLEGQFFVGTVTEEQKPWRTHPTVTTALLINGRRAVFKTGILSSYPAVIKLHVPGVECYLQKESLSILEIENKFRETVVFSFSMKDVGGLHFLKSSHTITLKALERTTVEIPYTLSKFLFYSEQLEVNAQRSDGTAIPFTKRLGRAFRGRTGILWGESDDYCEIFNGPYMVHMNKSDNGLWSARLYGDQYNPFWSFPKIGHPYSQELSSKKTDIIQCFQEEDTTVMKATYNLVDFPGLHLSVITRLENSGIIKHYYEVQNTSGQEIDQEIWLSDTFRQDLFRGILPYDNRFVSVGADTEFLPLCWDSNKITENWCFSKGKHTTRGVCWEPGQLIQFDNWCMFFEYNLGRLAPGQKAVTKPVTIAAGVFDRWQDFRAYALQRDIIDAPSAIRHTTLNINGGNPFVNEEFKVTLEEYRNMGATPSISVSKAKKDDDVAVVEERVTPSISASKCCNKNPEIVSAQVEMDCFSMEIQSAVFKKSSNTIQTEIETVSDKKVLTVDNGMLRFKASPDFSHALYSLQCAQNEWLDSSFPTPGIKAWWNPWFGGISLFFEGLSLDSMKEEDCEAVFVQLSDQFGNSWQGIRTSLSVEKNKKFRGLKLECNYLTLPGTPVLCNIIRVHQNTGCHFSWQYIENAIFPKTDAEICNNRLRLVTKDGNNLNIKAGTSQYYIRTLEPIQFESPNRKEKLLVYTDTDNQWLEAGVNSSMLMAFSGMHREMRNRDIITLPPTWLIFAEDNMNAALLQDLRNIRFNFEEELHKWH